jgi:DNA-binding MarR family transcriptional regulator
MTAPGTSQSLGFLVSDITRLLRRDFNRRAEPLGLTQAQWRTLAHLSRQEGVNQAALADMLEIQQMTLGRLIDRLEQSGLVERRRDALDRRSIRLFLTPAAQPLLARMEELAKQTRAIAIDHLSELEQRRLGETLSGVKRRLLQAEEAAEPRAADPSRRARNA